MKPQSTFGGTKNLRVTYIPVFKFLPKNYGHQIAIISCFAEGNWVFFASSGNKE
jgi:hypothetical protein